MRVLEVKNSLQDHVPDSVLFQIVCDSPLRAKDGSYTDHFVRLCNTLHGTPYLIRGQLAEREVDLRFYSENGADMPTPEILNWLLDERVAPNIRVRCVADVPGLLIVHSDVAIGEAALRAINQDSRIVDACYLDTQNDEPPLSLYGVRTLVAVVVSAAADIETTQQRVEAILTL